ncbi:MAG: hypothetical protein ABIP35_14995 [Ginsengibacter sp.]
MNSLFKNEKRDEALERIANGLTEGAKNCTTVIKKINSLCQNPKNYPNPSELISVWTEHLFANHFHDFIEEWTSPKIISIEHEEELANAFFSYFLSLTPFFYENKIVKSSGIIRPQKFKWTSDDYKELKVKLFHKWFYSEWDKWDGETRVKHGYKLELDTQKVVKSIAASSKAMTSIWNKQKRIDEIAFSDDLKMMMKKVMPDYQYEHQKDLFLKYTDDIVKRLPILFTNFDDNFYEVGSYLYKYFQWSND